MSTVTTTPLTVDKCLEEGLVACAPWIASLRTDTLVALEQDLVRWWDARDDAAGDGAQNPEQLFDESTAYHVGKTIELFLQDRKKPADRPVDMYVELSSTLEDGVLEVEELSRKYPSAAPLWLRLERLDLSAEGDEDHKWGTKVKTWILENAKHALPTGSCEAGATAEHSDSDTEMGGCRAEDE